MGTGARGDRPSGHKYFQNVVGRCPRPRTAGGDEKFLPKNRHSRPLTLLCGLGVAVLVVLPDRLGRIHPGTTFKVQELGQSIDLIVVLSVWKRHQLVAEIVQPSGNSWDVDVACFDAGRTCRHAYFFVRLGLYGFCDATLSS